MLAASCASSFSWRQGGWMNVHHQHLCSISRNVLVVQRGSFRSRSCPMMHAQTGEILGLGHKSSCRRHSPGCITRRGKSQPYTAAQPSPKPPKNLESPKQKQPQKTMKPWQESHVAPETKLNSMNEFPHPKAKGRGLRWHSRPWSPRHSPRKPPAAFLSQKL